VKENRKKKGLFEYGEGEPEEEGTFRIRRRRTGRRRDFSNTEKENRKKKVLFEYGEGEPEEEEMEEGRQIRKLKNVELDKELVTKT
jgi:hypothetical protein